MRFITIFRNVVVIVSVLSVLSCTKHYIPKTGDLVFQDLDCGDLCNAIEKVTQGVNGASFSHVGVIDVEKDTAFVLEAIGPGVIKTPFIKFLDRSRDTVGNPKVMVGRLKDESQTNIPEAIKYCKSLLGKPYDDAFDISNQKYYCSELVYYAFRNSKGGYLFELKPMTYNDPATGKIFPAWDTYFNELHVPVPEGKPGLNPGGISRSPAIKIVFSYY